MSFWSQFPPAQCLPDNCDCEFVRDALIAQPSAFWSSLSFIFFAILLYAKVEVKTNTLKLWTLCFILLGLSSHFAHASFIEPALAMDFAGIVLVISFFFIIKWLNRFLSNPWQIGFLLISYCGGLWYLFYSLEKWFKVGLCLLIFCIAIIELIHSEGKNFLKAKELHLALLIIFVSFGFFLVDELKLHCDPYGLIQGHSLWHLGAGLSLYMYGKWRFRGTITPTLPT